MERGENVDEERSEQGLETGAKGTQEADLDKNIVLMDGTN